MGQILQKGHGVKVPLDVVEVAIEIDTERDGGNSRKVAKQPA